MDGRFCILMSHGWTSSWQIADDISDVLAFDKTGRLIFRKDGKLNAGEIQKLIQTIKENL